MQLNPAARELIFKVVYFGPGMSGKTTNLTWLRDHAPAGTASELTVVDVHSERTLRFDVLASHLGQVQGHNIRIEFHTVPGQSYYAATRRQVLTGADGVVFVADGRREALDENIASMNEMLDNLRQLGMAQDIPVVLQYNKQDLPSAVPCEQFNPLMNVRNWTNVPASAISGKGVEESANALITMLVEAAANTRLPELPTVVQPRSWLISCHRCQSMLEVPDATIGAIFTCGVCNSTLEVIDPDRGLTREPAAERPSLTPQRQPQLPQQIDPGKDDSGYAMKTLPVQQEVVSSALQPTGGGEEALPGADFPLAGWTVVATLDESPQGRRMRVRETATGRTCRALVLSKGLMSQPGYIESLEPVVRLAGPLKHPHILPLLEMRPAGDTVVLISADCPDHEPLSLVLSRRRAIAPPHAMGILRQVVLALEDAARQGVVHGWLRPDIILVSPEGAVLVDEFAVPKNHRFLLHELAGSSAATEYYLAPEHLGEDARSDLRSDMFLCGALLYRMITGEGLVTGYNPHEALHKMLATGGRPLRSVGNSVSRDLDLFYKRLTATNRSERFDGYRQLVDILDRFGGGAKRQTMRLTQNLHGGGPSSARVGHTPPATALPRSAARPSSAGLRVGTGQFSNQAARRGTGEHRALPAPRQQSSAAGVIMTIIIVVLVLGAAGAFAYYRSQLMAPPPAPPVEPAAPRPAPTVGTDPSVNRTPAPTPPTPPANTTTTAQVPAPPPPTPPIELTPMQRRDVLSRISDLVLEEHWQLALTEATKLNTNDRQGQLKQIMTRRDARRKELEDLTKTATSLDVLQRQLKPALEDVWGVQGDREWARGLLDQAEARLAAAVPNPIDTQPTPPTTPDPQPTDPQTKIDPPTTRPADPVEPPPATPRSEPAPAVLGALAQGQFPLALSLATAVDEASAEGHALRVAANSYPRRSILLDRVAKARTAKLRLTHPTTRESVDVTAADNDGVEVTSPGGASSSLTWAQVGARETGRLLDSAANAPAAMPEDHACAITGLIIGGDITTALLHLKKARSAMTPELASGLDALIAIGRGADSARLLAQAQEAARSGQAKVLADLLVELRKPERTANPAVAAELAKLEAALQDLQGKTASTTKLADRVSFDGPDDLRQFSEQGGSWQVTAGSAANTSENARLGRRDAGNAHSVQVIFTPGAKRGTFVTEFKGLRLAFDLATGQFTTAVGATVVAPRPCSIVERVPNTLFIDHKDEGNKISIELNGQIIADTVLPAPGDVFAVAVGGGAVVQIDEIQFTRAEAAAPGSKALRQLGWESAGKVSLDDKQITLEGQPNTSASIARTPEAGAISYTIEVKGQGDLIIQLSGNGGPPQNATIKLPATQSKFTVRWAQGTFAVLDGNGVPLSSEKLERPVTKVAFSTAGSAVIVLPIRPSRQ